MIEALHFAFWVNLWKRICNRGWKVMIWLFEPEIDHFVVIHEFKG